MSGPSLTIEQIERASREAAREGAREGAREALEDLMSRLGLDISTPAGVRAVQSDFDHLRTWREAAEIVKETGLKAAVTAVATGLVATFLIAWPWGKH